MGMDIGNLIGPVAFGVIIQTTGSYRDVFALAPIITLIAAIFLLVPALEARRTDDRAAYATPQGGP
jgi:MFS family permease